MENTDQRGSDLFLLLYRSCGHALESGELTVLRAQDAAAPVQGDEPGCIELALRADRKKRAICTFLGSGPVQIVASQRNRDRVRNCCACWHISDCFRMGKADDGLILGFHTVD